MRTHECHAAANFLIGALVERREHALVCPAPQLLAVIGLGQLPQRGRIGHIGLLPGRNQPVGIAHVSGQAIEQGQAVYQQGRSGAGNRLIPRTEHLTAAPCLFEQGVTLRHAAAIGACQIGIAGAQLHAKVIERGATHAGTALNHIQMIGAEQNTRQHAAHARGGTSLAVAAKRTLTVLHA